MGDPLELQVADRYVRAMARELSAQALRGYGERGRGAVRVVLSTAGRVVEAPIYYPYAEGVMPEKVGTYDPSRLGLILVDVVNDQRQPIGQALFTVRVGPPPPVELPPATYDHLGDWLLIAVQQAADTARRHGHGLFVLRLDGAEADREGALQYVPLHRAFATYELSGAAQRQLHQYNPFAELVLLVQGAEAGVLGGAWRVPLAHPEQIEALE
jgi:hypothetical protein